MAKEDMLCPFSGKLCRECSLYRGRHYYLCFSKKYRGHLGKIEPDDRVEEYNLPGKSLLELPDDSPASLSIKKILTRADYGTI